VTPDDLFSISEVFILNQAKQPAEKVLSNAIPDGENQTKRVCLIGPFGIKIMI
jgi:hypothetical protein